jgi:hypothetical protein
MHNAQYLDNLRPEQMQQSANTARASWGITIVTVDDWIERDDADRQRVRLMKRIDPLANPRKRLRRR